MTTPVDPPVQPTEPEPPEPTPVTVTVFGLPRDVVVGLLGAHWPAAPGSTLVRIDPAAGVTDGAISIYTTPGRPGITWWLIDGVIPPQGAGAGGEALAALIPGAVAEYIPIPEPESPPWTGGWSSSPEQ